MSHFLTANELRELTGYVKPSKQIAWLQRHGIPHFVNAAGRPVVKADTLHKNTVAQYALGTVR